MEVVGARAVANYCRLCYTSAVLQECLLGCSALVMTGLSSGGFGNGRWDVRCGSAGGEVRDKVMVESSFGIFGHVVNHGRDFVAALGLPGRAFNQASAYCTRIR